MIIGKNKNILLVLNCLIFFSVIPVFSHLEQKSIEIESPKASIDEIKLITSENIS